MTSRYSDVSVDVFKTPFSRIAPKHWQGGYPLWPRQLKRAGFDVIVLAADDLQPEDTLAAHEQYPGMIVICAPLDDREGITDGEIDVARDAADRVVEHLGRGRRVLVTCQMGWNRSGLISGLALCQRCGMAGSEAIATIQKVRPKALFNESFCLFNELISTK